MLQVEKEVLIIDDEGYKHRYPPTPEGIVKRVVLTFTPGDKSWGEAFKQTLYATDVPGVVKRFFNA